MQPVHPSTGNTILRKMEFSLQQGSSDAYNSLSKPEDITPSEISQPLKAGKCEMPRITKLVDTERLSASYQVWGSLALHFYKRRCF